MDSLDKDTVALLSRRAFDVAASTRGVKVFLNGKRLPIKNFKDYVDLCLKVLLIHFSLIIIKKQAYHIIQFRVKKMMMELNLNVCMKLLVNAGRLR
jgi:DNA topoisomerase-2